MTMQFVQDEALDHKPFIQEALQMPRVFNDRTTIHPESSKTKAFEHNKPITQDETPMIMQFVQDEPTKHLSTRHLSRTNHLNTSNSSRTNSQRSCNSSRTEHFEHRPFIQEELRMPRTTRDLLTHKGATRSSLRVERRSPLVLSKFSCPHM
jgi:hypothetical protein